MPGSTHRRLRGALSVEVPSGGSAAGYYRALTVDKTKVPSTQSNFPVLVSVTHATLKTVANGGHVANSHGYDIGFFADSAGTTPLKWELERYNAATGEVVAWVKIPSLSSSVDTVFYVFYGDAAISTDQSDPTAVWSNGFAAVYHLGAMPASPGWTQRATDSFTGTNGNNLTTSGNWTAVKFSMLYKSNAIEPSIYPDFAVYGYNGYSFLPDHYSEVQLVSGGSGGITIKELGVCVRLNPVTGAHYNLRWDPSSTTLQLVKSLDGITSVSLMTTSKSYSAGVKLRLEAVGSGTATRLYAYEDTGSGWVAVWSAIDPGAGYYLDDGMPGIVGYESTLLLDNWAGGDSSVLSYVLDSTGANHGRMAGTVNSVTGKIDNGAEFNGNSANRLDIPSPAVAMPLTISAWFNVSNPTNEQCLTGLTALSVNRRGWWLEIYSGGIIAITADNGNWVFSSKSGVSTSTWMLASAVFTSATSRTAYLNGVAGTPETTSRNPSTTDAGVLGAYRDSNGYGNPVNGSVDEVRIASVARSDDWLVTEYNSQGAPGTFISLGDEVVREEEEIMAELDVTLDAATLGSTGTVPIAATLAKTLGAAVLAASGALPVQAALTRTLGGATLSATVAVSLSGTLTKTLDAATLASAATLSIASALDKILDGANLASAGALAIQAGADVTLEPATLEATGGSQASVADLNVTLADATLSAAGQAIIGASAAVHLGDATLSSQATVFIVADANNALESVVIVSGGTVLVAGAADILLGAAQLQAGAQVRIAAVADILLDDAILIATIATTVEPTILAGQLAGSVLRAAVASGDLKGIVTSSQLDIDKTE
jgi:hypothetical protein